MDIHKIGNIENIFDIAYFMYILFALRIVCLCYFVYFLDLFILHMILFKHNISYYEIFFDSIFC
ncbi:hypothetical protein AB840_01390 [Megasphaera cerevisiae DSM 20462]|uniref:Uncharacterized protein n=1 Tax=Megasphaera cerevisiae DSM 20462 TaxID=1122219 RepID=A0A0J6WVQ4_9FIRM|nr:hypothetical protein AB840_01390 [Megasphaera cerevisiae DSM 20462]OKY54702.1 hypothetical protein BSR42_01300 [Megasphaera cerevisiae]